MLAAMARETSLKKEKVAKPVKNVEPINSSAAPKLAPELIPKTKGPANGFLNNVCIKRPLKDNPAPTNMEVNAFGIR